ncbi:cytochrome b5-like heme/steroid binding domain-containing protein [Dipodascopsis tothii]|uniref:cytochrome b5-like heme/steroid binding domain-containing protein n=1 Tax=Dipodascopsis tothii TaxID=44089 RepID=UPI0034CF9328
MQSLLGKIRGSDSKDRAEEPAQFPAADSPQRAGGSLLAPPNERPLPVFRFTQSNNAEIRQSVFQNNRETNCEKMKRREKVALEPGFSQLDWAKLRTSGKDLRGLPPGTGMLKVTPAELGRHATEADAWMAISGKVYNISPYLRYHPGGKAELMRCAGGDGTSLFMRTHSWVNYDRMLAHCLVGVLVPA